MPVVDNIAQRSDAEACFRSEVERLSSVTPAMLHSIDEQGRLISVSDMWLDKLGYNREEVLGRPSSDFLTPESSEHAIRDVLPAFFRLGRCDNVEYQMLRKDGGVVDVLLSAVLDNDAFGGGRVSRAVITDVTALKLAKRQLAASEARYRGLVERQSELVSITSPEGEIHYVNRAYASFHGMSCEEMVGQNLFDFVPVESHASLAQHLQRVCSSELAIENENQVILPDGERRWLHWSNRALRDPEGRITAIQAIGRDIQERVQAEERLRESETRYRFLADNSTDLIMLVQSDGRRLFASPASKTLLGYEPNEMLEIQSRDAIHPDDIERVLRVLDKAPGTPKQADYTLSYRMRRKDGRYIWVETTGKAVNITGPVDQRLVIVRDIDRRMRAEQKLKESEALYRLLADNSTDMVFQLDHNLVRQYVSPSCRELLGYEPEDLVGIKPVTMAHPDDAPLLALVFQTLMSGEVDRHSIINRIRHRSGKWIWVEAKFRAVKDPDTAQPTGIIGALRDISVRKQIEDELAEANRRLQTLAGEDSLTGLANRRTFDEAFANEYRRARREKKDLSLIMIDVDRFKAFNDQYGHLAGDECLRQVGRAIARATRRAGDLAARYGGEEFVILLPNTDEAGAVSVAEDIRRVVLDLAIRHDDGLNQKVTISAGAASLTMQSDGDNPKMLMKAADLSLYRAKECGRNTVMRANSIVADAPAARSRATG